MDQSNQLSDNQIKFSIVIPARDEQKYIGACLQSVREASKPYPGQVQTIVVINRCTDATEKIARENGAAIVYDDSKNLSKIRNSGAKMAIGSWSNDPGCFFLCFVVIT